MASEATRKARWMRNPALRLTYLDIAQRWRKMAEQFEVQEVLLQQNRARRKSASLLSCDRGRRIAANIAKMPE